MTVFIPKMTGLWLKMTTFKLKWVFLGKIQRPVKYIEETDLYKTSARSYGAIKPRDDEIGPAIRQDSASNYRPNDTVGINRKFSRHLGELGQYRSYRNHSFR